jgi:hypothetical protein
MQGRAQDQPELLDAESVAGHLLKAGSVFAFLAGHRRELFPDELFADLFPSRRGRPSIPADVVASVIVLQTLHGLSDSEAAEAVTFDLRWKAAIGWPVTQAAFHDTTLTYWRRRLAASERPNRIFEAVQEVVAQTGALKGKTRRALDSTVLDDAVATQDTVTQLIAAIRKVRRQVEGADVVVARVTSAHDYDDPGKPKIAWNDEQARRELIDALVRDGHARVALARSCSCTAPATSTRASGAWGASPPCLWASPGAMLGLVLADGLLLLYVFWELTSVTSFLLIGFDDEREDSRRAATQALLVTTLGGLVLLAGLVLLGQADGTSSVSELLADPPSGAGCC